MSNVQIWNGSTWIDFYTLPNATSSTLGGVKIGNNITVSNGTISLTKSNVTSALGYTPLSLSGGTMTGVTTLPENKMAIKFRTNNSYETGFIYGTTGNEAITLAMKNPVTAFQIVYGTTPSAFTSNTWQSVTPLFQTKDSKVIINRKITQTSDTTNLKLLDVNGDMAATTIYENGTSLVNKYLGINAKASNSNKLDGQLASYYAKDSEVVKTSGNQDNIGGDKTFNGQTTIDNLTLTTINGAPTINVYNTQNVSGYLVSLPYNNGLDCTIASTADLPTAGTGLNLSNGVFSVKTGYTTNEKNYKVAADNSGNLYVSVPWTDTNTDTHYINYLQIKGNDTEAVKFTQKENTSLNLKPGSNVSISATSGEITISATDTKYNAATQSAAGLMSSTDKTKLDGIATGATKVTTDTVSGWGYTKNTGTVTQVKVGTTAYNPSSGVVSLPAYPSIPTSLKNPNSVTIKAGTDTVSSYDGSAAKTFTFAASTTAGAFTVSDGTTTKTIQLAGKFTDNNTWRPVVDNLTSTATDQSLSANQGKVLKGLVDGKAASNHTHSSVLDIGNSTATTFAYSKSGLGYDNYTWLAGWNGYELRAVNKSHFATADHTHSQYLTAQKYRPIQVNGATLLANTIDTALNLKAGTNITLLSNRSTGVITINSTASGGLTCTLVFEGAGERQGSYWLNGKTTTISANNYKMLLFEINVNDVNFYLPVPTNFIVSGSTYFYLAAGNTNNGAMGIVEVMANNTGFNVSVSNGNIIVYNVNIYAYK